MSWKAHNLISRYPHLVHSVFLAVVIVGLYLQTAGHDFLLNWDDREYITLNRDIAGFTFDHLWNVFTRTYVGNYAPVHMLSYMLDYSIWGLAPAAFKATNYLLHLGCTLLFYRLLVRLGLTPLQSVMAAFLFAVHPVQVESVAWASQRKNPLSLLFFLASWCLWIRWREEHGPRRKRAYAWSLALFAVALLAKSVAVVLPLFLMAQDHLLYRRKISLRMLLDTLPYILLAGLCFVVTVLSQTQGAGGGLPYHGGSLGITMMNMLPVFTRYLVLLLFPFHLATIYSMPLKTVPDAGVYLGAAILALFLAGLVRLYRPHPRQFFFLTLFLLGLLPVANIIPIPTLMNDRYLYYPMLGMAPFAVTSLQEAFTRCSRPVRAVLHGTAAGILLLLAVGSYSRIGVWKSSLTLWPDTIAKADAGAGYQGNARFLEEAYGDALAQTARKAYDAGEVKKARTYYLLALGYDPFCYQALTEYSKVLMLGDKPLVVRNYLLRLTDRYPRTDEGQYVLGVNYSMTGEYEKAAEHFRKALAINPENAQARSELADLEKHVHR